MLRLGVAGVLVAMGALAGCTDDLSSPDTNTAEQAVSVCDGKMPYIKAWDGSALQPLKPSSVLVAFQYVASQKTNDVRWLISDYEVATGQVVRAVSVKDGDYRFASLSENLVRLAQAVRIPGIPPEPCNSDPFYCYPFIRAVALHTNQALYDARKEAGTCF